LNPGTLNLGLLSREYLIPATSPYTSLVLLLAVRSLLGLLVPSNKSKIPSYLLRRCVLATAQYNKIMLHVERSISSLLLNYLSEAVVTLAPLPNNKGDIRTRASITTFNPASASHTTYSTFSDTFEIYILRSRTLM